MGKINKAELVEFFLMESEEHLETILNGLLVLEKDPDNWSIIDEMFRSAHTIKGSAAMVGFVNVSEVAHKLEDILDELRKGLSKANNNAILRILTVLEKFANLLKNRRNDFNQEESNYFFEQLEKFENEIKVSDVRTLNEEHPINKQLDSFQESKKILSRSEIVKNADKKFSSPADSILTDNFIRIRLDRLDTLLNFVGELITNKNRQNERVRKIQEMSYELEYARNRLNKLIKEFEEKYAFNVNEISKVSEEKSDFLLDDFQEGEFDRYDDINIFTRRLAEIGNDIIIIINQIMSHFLMFEDEIAYINRITDNLQKGLTSIRLIPVDRLFNVAIRVARTTAISENKKVKILISGEKIELDKTLVDSLTESFIHLIRNAVSHGIEIPQKRKALGKDEEGTIRLKAQRIGNTVSFEISDDGCGVNYDAIRKRIVELGFADKYESENMRADKLIEYLFYPGFSTKEEAGDISGRGVGLDVVKRNIESLNGNLSVESDTNKGTKFVLNVPVTLLIADYLLVKENDQIFAIPAVSVQETFGLDKNNIKKIGDIYFYKLRGEAYEIHDLGYLLKQEEEPVLNTENVGVLVDGPRKKYVITVESIEGRETSVTKKLGSFFEGLKHFSGATISPQGLIRLILDPIRLMEKKTSLIKYSSVVTKQETEEKGIKYLPNSILVVDDSISVRKYLIKLLTSAGYLVDSAYDGANALTYLDKNIYDIVITDLEMPIMHGYELLENIRKIRGDERTTVFVLTSRATEKHKEKAFQMGANGFIVKPFNDEDVLEQIKGVMLERT
jgi:chemosensory pili system protein ChpA (sensor histidine kinase/response regulator)